VVRTAVALDPNTHTLLTEVHVPNPDDALRPGMSLQVKFGFDRTGFPAIPSAAVVIHFIPLRSTFAQTEARPMGCQATVT